MNCQEFLTRHSEYLDGELAEIAVAGMRAHMAGCESCARYDRVLRRGLTLLRDAEPIQPAADPYVSLHQHLVRTSGEVSRPRLSAAATLAAAAVLGLLAWSALSGANDPTRSGTGMEAAVERVDPDPSWRWANPVVSGMDLVGPGLPVVARWPHVGTVAQRLRSDRALMPLRTASLDAGPYTPLVVEPPDIGQDDGPALVLSAYTR